MVDIVKKHNIVVLEAVAAYIDPLRKENEEFTRSEMGPLLLMGARWTAGS